VGSTSTKRQIVTAAYEECSLAGYEFDITPEEQIAALRQLDALMRMWQPTLPLGYNFPAAIGAGDLDDPSGIPDYAFDVSAQYLALRIMPKMGKSISAESRYALAAALVSLRTQASFIPNATLPRTTIRGAGNRWNRQWPFFLGDILNASSTLSTLSLASLTASHVAAFTAVINGTSAGSTLVLINNPGGLYSLTAATTGANPIGVAIVTWSLNRAAGGIAGTEIPVVQEVLNDAYGSPASTPFIIVIT
jgi:hypothetical protein